MKRLAGLFLLVFLLLSSRAHASSSAGMTLTGVLEDAGTNPVESSNVQFKVQIRTPGPTSCLLFEETRTLDMTGSKGVFAISVNDGNGTRTDTSGYDFNHAFANTGTFVFAAASCAGANTYTPAAADGRNLVISFNDGTFTGWESLPSVAMNQVPLSLEAYQVGGFPSSSLLRVADSAGPQPTSPLSPANFSELMALVNGTSTQYQAAGSGGLTSIVAGTGLTGGTINTSGQTIAVDVGTTGGKIPQLNASGQLPALDGGLLTILNASSLSLGTVPAARMPAFTGDVTSTAGSTALTLANVPTSKGGTGLASMGTANQVLGMNAGATALEYKTITAGTGVSISNSAGALTINATSPGGSVSSVNVSVPAYMTSSGGPIVTGGTIALGFNSQPSKSVFAAPSTATGTPAFRSLAITDILSTVSGNFFAASGACPAGQTLTYSSVSDNLDCAAYALTTTQVTSVLGGSPVVNAGGATSLAEGIGASIPSAGTAGRLYVSTDSKRILRDSGSSWDVIGTSLASDLTGTLNTAQLPTVPVANGGTGTTSGSITGTSSLVFTAGGSGQNVVAMPSGEGMFSVGTSAPTSTLHIRSSTPGVSSSGITLSASAGGTTFNLSGSGLAINSGDYIVPSASTSQARFVSSVSGLTLTMDPANPLTAGVTGEAFTVYRPIIGAYNGSSAKLVLQGYTGRLGVGNKTPSAGVDVIAGLPNQNNIGLRGSVSVAHTQSGTYLDFGVQSTLSEKIPAGITNNGNIAGNYVTNLRNYGTSGDSGSLAKQRGIEISYGHSNSDGSTPQTADAAGLVITPFTMSGTVTNMFDILLASTNTGAGTVSNSHWAIYQNDSSVSSYFAGKIGIGTSVPAYPLDVVGDIRTSTCIRTSAGVTGGTCTSDARLKTGIKSFDLGLSVLTGLRPKTFRYNGLGENAPSTQDELGVIAQDVERVAPSLVETRAVLMHPGDTEKTEIKTVNYSAFLYVVINSVRELFDRVTEQSGDVAKLRVQVEAQGAEIELLRHALCARDPGLAGCPTTASAR